MTKLWYSIWPEGVPKNVEFQNKPMYSLIDDNAKLKPDKKALIYNDKVFTYSDMHKYTNGSCLFFRELGVNKGDKIAITMFNCPDVLIHFFGALKCGASIALIDPLTISEDLEFQLKLTNPKVVITDEEVYNREKAVFEKLGIRAEISSLRKTDKEVELAKIYPVRDVAVIFHYAGVVGRTLEIHHSHAGFVTLGKAVSTFHGLNSNTSTLMFLPLSHPFGMILTSVTYAAGGTLVLMRRWTYENGIKYIEEKMVNYVPGPPMVFNELLTKADKEILKNIKIAVTGGAYVPPELQKSYFEEIGVPLVQLYGLSEGLLITLQHPSMKVYGTLGVPLPSVDVKVVNPQTLEEVKVGETGELWAKSPWIMVGYGDPEETKKAIVDGWLRTGDLVMMDNNGLLYFKGVIKRMIKYKAYPIFPRDLEIILKQHPAIKEAVVEGEKAPEVGEIPVAKVKLKSEFKGKVSEEEIKEFVNSKVAFYKKIRKVYFID